MLAACFERCKGDYSVLIDYKLDFSGKVCGLNKQVTGGYKKLYQEMIEKEPVTCEN